MPWIASPWKTTAVCAVLALSILGIVLWLAPKSATEHAQDHRMVQEERDLMGTIWLIQASVGLHQATAPTRAAIEAAFSELSRIDNLMSEWKPSSPVSAINAAAGRRLVSVPQELVAMIKRAIAFSRLTDGAFDITWKGLAPLWHFDETFRVPQPEAIRAALGLVDFHKINLEGNQVGLACKGMALGLGGIAKGYAIDRAAAVLRGRNCHNFLVNGGGDVLVGGSRGDRPWRIGVRDPRGGAHKLVARLQLSSGAVVTSGDYERFKIVDGIRYHHIIDPRTGSPARGCRSVTVVAPAAEDADVLATAVFVQGPSKGLRLISSRENTEVLIIDDSGKFWMTDGFRKLAQFYQ